MKILVTGARGWIGRKVCEYLASQSHVVIGADVLPVNSEWLLVNGGGLSSYTQLDITKPIPGNLTSDSRLLASGIDAVIHCAGYAHRPNETADEQKLFYAVNRDGTQHVLDWCERQGIKRFLYVSSIAFYDWERGRSEVRKCEEKCAKKCVSSEVRECASSEVRKFESARVLESGSSKVTTLQSAARNPNNHQPLTINGVTEEYPVALPTHYAKSKYEGEELVRNSPLDWRVVRLATVFGDGDRANFSRMASAMQKHLFPIFGKGCARKSVIPVALAAELIAEFTLLDHPPHQLINLGLPTAPSLAEICDAYHQICGLPKCLSIPMPLAKGLGLCGDLAAKILGKFPFTSLTLGKLTSDTVVDVSRMQDCFPDREFGSFRDYLKQCAEYYKSL